MDPFLVCFLVSVFTAILVFYFFFHSSNDFETFWKKKEKFLENALADSKAKMSSPRPQLKQKAREMLSLEQFEEKIKTTLDEECNAFLAVHLGKINGEIEEMKQRIEVIQIAKKKAEVTSEHHYEALRSAENNLKGFRNLVKKLTGKVRKLKAKIVDSRSILKGTQNKNLLLIEELKTARKPEEERINRKLRAIEKERAKICLIGEAAARERIQMVGQWEEKARRNAGIADELREMEDIGIPRRLKIKGLDAARIEMERIIAEMEQNLEKKSRSNALKKAILFNCCQEEHKKWRQEQFELQLLLDGILEQTAIFEEFKQEIIRYKETILSYNEGLLAEKANRRLEEQLSNQ